MSDLHVHRPRRRFARGQRLAGGQRFVALALAVASLLMVLGLPACGDPGTGVERTAARPDLMAWVQYAAGRPELHVAAGDGTLERRISFAGAVDPIPGNPDVLPPVRDENIRAMGPVRWSPASGTLAVVLSLAFDQSEVVLVQADGADARVASINTQYITSDVDWAPDGSKIAYAMATSYEASAPEIMTTDLQTHEVTQVTHTGGVGGPGVEVRFSTDRRALYYSTMRDIGEDPLDSRRSMVVRVDLATGAADTTATGMQGMVVGIERSGAFALVLRNTVGGRALFRVPLASPGTGTPLYEASDLQFARLGDHEDWVLVAQGDASSPGALRYRLVSWQDGAPAPRVLDWLTGATSAAAFHRYPPD